MTTQIIPTQPLTANAFLIPLHSQGGQSIAIEDTFTIGRGAQNQLQLASKFISQQHARITKTPNGYLLEDLDSSNGTLVNDTRIQRAVLTINDVIKLGENEFLFTCNPKLTISSNPSLKSKNRLWNQNLQSLPLFSQTDLPVFLLGESGTGKEVLAKLIHEHSSRADKPFISINCSAINESLVESELFGHRKGSFTDAKTDRKGAFEAARGGTLFLDEIGDLPINIQPKLLRALENKEIRPIGSDQIIPTDVRIIAATHKNIKNQIQEGSFRADLYFRLHVIQMNIPSLRNRIEDFEDLLYTFGKEMHVRFSHNTVTALQKHPWPGNIRELKNLVSRASALFPKQQIQPEHLTTLLDLMPNGGGKIYAPAVETQVSVVKEIERELIVKRLIANNGNQRKTAAELGIPKSTLHDRIKTYNIEVASKKPGKKSDNNPTV